MTVKKSCVNCTRTKTIVAQGLCYVCYTAAKDKAGDDREAALVAIKKKLENGDVHEWHKTPGSLVKRKAPASTPPARNTKEGEKAVLGPGSRQIRADLAPVRNTIVAPIATSPCDIPITVRLTIEVGIRLVGAVGGQG